MPFVFEFSWIIKDRTFLKVGLRNASCEQQSSLVQRYFSPQGAVRIHRELCCKEIFRRKKHSQSFLI